MKGEIARILKKILRAQGVDLNLKEIERFIGVPPSVEMGDYSFPCFFLTEKLKQSPVEIALEIRKKIGDVSGLFDEVQTIGGYVNFFVDRKTLSFNIVKDILEKNQNFGRENIGNGKKALVEHTSINPNAPPHIGRARNAIIGDSIVRILRFMNYKTDIHYYVNDVSKQIAMLVLALKNEKKLEFNQMLKKYIGISKKVEKSKDIEKEVFELLSKFEQKDPKVLNRFKEITKICIEGQESILSKLGIKYDKFDYESDYIEKSKKILKKFKRTRKLFIDDEKRLVLNQSDTSIKNKMKSPFLVLTRSDGTGLYPLRDIVYTIEKMKLSLDKNIVVLGEDQKLYFQQISEALKLLKIKSPEVVHYSFILLRKKTKTKKMSTRKGDVVLLEDFLKEAVRKAKHEISKRKTNGNPEIVGISAVKYAILKNNINKSIIFDLDDALNFEGDTGPYLLYSYARASSILRKSGELSKEIQKPKKIEQKEFEIIKKFSEFPEIALSAYKNLSPSIIANYSYQLAQIFNEFYHACPVIGSENQQFRLLMVESFRIILENSLNLLGINVLEEM